MEFEPKDGDFKNIGQMTGGNFSKDCNAANATNLPSRCGLNDPGNNRSAVSTTQIDEIYGELFEYARDGLELRGVSTRDARRYIKPLRERVDRRMTPARFKHDIVKDRVEKATPLAEAIWGMQSTYIENQRDTLIEGSFVDWLA